MKSKSLVLLTAIISVAAASSVYAQGASIGVSADISVGVKSSTSASSTIRGNATSSAAKDKATTTPKSATATAAQNKKASTTSNGETMSESHRSIVAAFVHSLLSVADREGGIGAQVRIIAQSQNDSSSTTVDAMNKVESRGSVRTFFFGSDYKSLGVIRSEIATTTANIAHLQALLSKTTNISDRAELELQIKTLEAEQVKLTAYVEAHENTFSLFGWFNRMRAK